MASNIKGSQVADRGSNILNSNNESQISIKKIRTEAVIISFIVGFLASLLASYIYEKYIK
jgi:hypothetical protein